jgi:hypothetical protein
VRGVGRAVDLSVRIQHGVGAAAEAPELNILVRDLLGDFVDVARGLLDLEADSAKFAAKRCNERGCFAIGRARRQ